MTNVEALQSATIVPAKMTGMVENFGSIAPGKVANIILVDGDVSQNINNFRHVNTVFLDGYLGIVTQLTRERQGKQSAALT